MGLSQRHTCGQGINPIVFAPSLKEEDQGSSFIVIVRKFLEQELSSTNEIELQILGPSPFHANFIFGSPPENFDLAGQRYAVIQVNRRGYDLFKVYFSVDGDFIENFTDIASLILDEVEKFYRIILIQSQLIHLSTELDYRVDSLIEIEMSQGFFSYISNFFKKKRIIYECQILMNSFTSHVLSSRVQIQDCTNDNYSEQPIQLESYIRDAVKEIELLSEHGHRDIISFMEQRRLDRNTKILVVFSAIFGGLFGSVLTLILGK